MLAYPVNLHNKEQALKVLEAIGVEPSALNILAPKSQHVNIVLKSVKTSWANIIKQEMLACGGDAAISKSSYACLETHTDVLLIGSESVLERFISKMKSQPECFAVIANEVEKVIRQGAVEVKIGSRSFDLKKDFIVLGVLNVTPDSFSDGGKFSDYDSAMKHAEYLLSNGANVLDVGGESTRPGGGAGVSVQEELDRVIPVIESVNKNFKPLISIDSYKPEVIKQALASGARLVNDISGGKGVEACLDVIRKYEASALLMMNHSPGSYCGSTPEADLFDPIGTFLDFCETKKQQLGAMAQGSAADGASGGATGDGISGERLIFDPGIGFGLSTKDINTILMNMHSFTGRGFAVCAGLSRKSYLGRVAGLQVSERDTLTNAISLSLMSQGVRIFRTHDTAGLAGVIKFFKSTQGS
jgi:dihydropteroate synthase